MKILFIGGCILSPGNINKESVFHALLSGNFPEMQKSLAFYTEYSHLNKVIKKKADGCGPQLIVLFIRPFPFLVLNRLYIKLSNEKKQTIRQFHPAVSGKNDFNKWTDYSEAGSAFPVGSVIQMKRSGLGFVNLAVGYFLGLNKWACRYVMNQVEQAHAICTEKNGKLLLIGPPNVQNNRIENKIYRNLNTGVLKFAALNNVAAIDLFNTDFSPDMFIRDNFHFNERGHRMLSDKIGDVLKSNTFASIFTSE